MTAYRINAYSVNFESFYRLEDVAMVAMFKSLEVIGLCSFLSLPLVTYEDFLLDFYAHTIVTMDKKISYTLHGQTYVFDEIFFASTFYLPTEGLCDFSQVSSSIMNAKFSLIECKIFSHWCWCLLLVQKEGDEDGVLSPDELRSKDLLVKAGFFNASTRNKFLVMVDMTSNTKIDWSTILYNVLVDMIVKQATGFSVQISKMFSILGVRSLLLKIGPKPRC